MARGVSVSIVPFEISADEAIRRFEEYQRRECSYLHASSLLGGASVTCSRPSGPESSSTAAPNDTVSSSSKAGSSAGPASDGRGAGAGPGRARAATERSRAGHGEAEGKAHVTATYLPFWCFDVAYSCTARAKLGYRDDR
jgi:hypothetical protein